MLHETGWVPVLSVHLQLDGIYFWQAEVDPSSFLRSWTVSRLVAFYVAASERRMLNIATHPLHDCATSLSSAITRLWTSNESCRFHGWVSIDVRFDGHRLFAVLVAFDCFWSVWGGERSATTKRRIEGTTSLINSYGRWQSDENSFVIAIYFVPRRKCGHAQRCFDPATERDTSANDTLKPLQHIGHRQYQRLASKRRRKKKHDEDGSFQARFLRMKRRRGWSSPIESESRAIKTRYIHTKVHAASRPLRHSLHSSSHF